jgi:hypothetical protein
MASKANEYFHEFQEKCQKDEAFMKSFMDQMVALTPRASKMTIEELSPYADYVTQKMATENNEVFLDFAKFNLEHFKKAKEFPNVGLLANMCFIVLEMHKRGMDVPEGTEKRIKALPVQKPS